MHRQIRHLVAFVAEQTLDAVSVAFDSRFAIERITLLGQAHQLDDVGHTVTWLQQRLGVPVAVQTLDAPLNAARFLSQATQLLQSAGADAGVNLNTEDAASACLMAQAAQQLGLPVFAVDTRSDRLIWLHAGALHQPALDIQDRLGCADVFQIQGYTLRPVPTLARYAQKLAVCPLLLAHACRDEGVLQRLVPKTGLCAHTRDVPPDLVQGLQAAGLLRRDARSPTRFADDDALAFVRGGWLELAVFDRLRRIAPTLGAQDVRRSTQIRHTVSGQVIEFDVVCMMNNQLHLIECKSGDSRGAKFVSHFEGITRSHGLRARCMLVSVDALSSALVAVAQGMHIACVHGPDLRRLDDALHHWLVQARGPAE